MGILSVTTIPSNGLSISGGVISIAMGGTISPTPQVGQLVRILNSDSVPTSYDIWAANTYYPEGKYVINSGTNPTTYLALNAGVSGSINPLTSSTPAGTLITDNQGTGYSTPYITWVAVQAGTSWSFNGKYHLTFVGGGGASLQVRASSEFAFFLPSTLAGTGGNGSLIIMNEPELTTEVYSLAHGSILYQTDIAYTGGVFVVTLPSASPTLTRLFNALYNQNNLIRPVLSKQYVRLIDTQSYWGAQFNGLYPILDVVSDTQFVVEPQFLPAVTNDYGGGGMCTFLASMGTSIPTGTMDMGDSSFAAGVGVSDDLLIPINQNSKACATRFESKDMGYWKDGGQVPTFTSDVDGYVYTYDEIGWALEYYSTALAWGNNPDVGFGAFKNGTRAPVFVNPQTTGTLIITPYTMVLDNEGNVSATIYTSDGSETQGVVRVIARGTRRSTQVVLPPAQLPKPAVIP